MLTQQGLTKRLTRLQQKTNEQKTQTHEPGFNSAVTGSNAELRAKVVLLDRNYSHWIQLKTRN